MKINEKSIFLAGNFLSEATGTRGVGEELQIQFSRRGYEIFTASRYFKKIRRMCDFLWTAWSKRKKISIAILEVYSGPAFRWAEVLSFLLRILEKPYVLTLHGGKLPEFYHQHPGRVRRLLLSANAVTTPASFLLDAFREIRPSIRHIPNGIEITHYPHTTREEFKPNLMWMRAFHKIYSPTLAVQVLNLIRKSYPAAKLTMIGPDKHDGSYIQTKEMVHMLGLDKSVIFAGTVAKEDVGEHLAQGDIFLNTTNYESFGVSVIEAAACGLCIVSTNVGELPNIWEEGVDALLVPPNDAQAMAAAVELILRDAVLAKTLSKNAQKKSGLFDWSGVIPQWMELIKSIVNENGI